MASNTAEIHERMKVDTEMYITKLVARSVTKDQAINFKKGMNIIGGAIATGKTAILKYIDYCLGKDDLPRDPEFKKIDTVFLEVRFDEGRASTVERTTNTKAEIVIHECAFAEIGKGGKKRFPVDRYDYFTEKIGLKDVKVKKDLRTDDSPLVHVGFRGFMRYCYLDEERIDTKKNLVFETSWEGAMFRKGFDVLFKILDAGSTEKQEEIRTLTTGNKDLESSVKTIEKFMAGFAIPSSEVLAAEKVKLEDIKAQKTAVYRNLVENQVQITDVCKDLREDLKSIEKERSAADRDLRDKEVMRMKLNLLLGQYREDVLRIKSIIQAKALFDPIGITRCPACLETVEASSTGAATCFLCGNERKIHDHESDIPSLSTEKKRTEAKARELEAVLGEMEGEIALIKFDIKELDATYTKKSQELQQKTERIINPTVESREKVFGEINDVDRKIAEKDQFLAYHASISTKNDQATRNKARIGELEKEMAQQASSVVDKAKLAFDSSSLFHDTLKAIHYEKLDEGGTSHIDNNLIPHVRGVKYDAVGSKGNATMINQAYYISLFKLLKKHENIHPRFFMVDSPGNAIGWSGLKGDLAIIESIYDQISSLIDESILDQVIVVDNRPPVKYENKIIVKYSRNKDQPPYGFIDDETGAGSLLESVKDAILKTLAKNKIIDKSSKALKQAIGMDITTETLMDAVKELAKEKKIMQDPDKNIVLFK